MDAARSISDYSVLTERREEKSGTILVSKPSHTKEPIAPMGMRQLPLVRMVDTSTRTLVLRGYIA